MNKWQMLDALEWNLDKTKILVEIIAAMSDDTAKDILEYVARMHDVNLDGEDK